MHRIKKTMLTGVTADEKKTNVTFKFNLLNLCEEYQENFKEVLTGKLKY